MKRIAAFILVLATLLLASCGNTDNTVGEESGSLSSDASAIEPSDIVIAENGESEYVIVCNYKNSIEKSFADDLWEMIFSSYGVSLTTRSASGYYDKEIIIGDAGRSATGIVKAQLSQTDDFGIFAVDDDIVLYATDEEGYAELLLALRDFVFADADTQRLIYRQDRNFISSLNPDMSFKGCEVVLLDNKLSDYNIVYGEDDSDSMMYAMYLKKYFNEKFGVNLSVRSDSASAAHEIVLSGAQRSTLKTLEAKLDVEDDFSVSVLGDDVFIAATDNKMMVLAMMKFVDMCIDGEQASSVRLFEIANYLYSKKNRSYEYSAKEYCERYQSIYNTFSTYREEKLENISWLRDVAKADQALVEALVERMGSSAVFLDGSSSVLYNGYVRKLDTKDYSLTAKIENGTVKIPRQFAEGYFGKTLNTDADGYVNITEHCQGNGGYSVWLSDDGKMAVLVPKSVQSFANASEKIGGYTNKQYCERMREFFASPVFPEPGVNTEQTRVVLEDIQYPEYALDFETQQYQTTYSPGIVVVQENGKSVYYVSYEICTIVNYEELAVYTVVKKSVDGGSTWTTVVDKIPDLRWASPFENKGTVYLIGSDIYTGAAVIAKVNPDGVTKKVELFNKAKVSGTCPGTVLHANGRIYKAYLAATISADENADLMKPESWTLSNKTNSEDLAYWGNEGSMVLGKDGQVYQVMHTDKADEAIVLRLSADGTTYTHTNAATKSYVEFPTCVSKTSVIYDEVSGKYIALSNPCNTKNERQRNILALVVSDDLVNWEIAEYILVDREMINPYYSTVSHAFQYTDFKIDGNDIVMVIREAAGYTNTYHDGNYCTFYRINDFRELLDNARGDYPEVN